MPDTQESAQHLKPFVYEGFGTKALHFSISHIQSRMLLDDPYVLDVSYTRTMMGFLLFNPQPQQIAMIGLGGGSLAKFCYRYLPQSHIQVVEINPHVIALRDDFHVPRDDARFRVVRGDGALFVHQLSCRLDVLLVDGFDSDGMPARLASQRFYDNCHESLAADGIMVVNLHTAHPHYETYLDRIRRSFNGSVLVVDDGRYGNSIVFACKGDALERQRGAVLRRPRDFDAHATKQLLGAFAAVTSALNEQCV